MSLRTRLLLAVLACVAAGLLVAGVATYVSLRGFLLERVDAQLKDARVPIAMALTDSAGVSGLPGGPGGNPGAADLPPGTYGQLRDSDGNIINAGTFDYGQTDLPTPVLPASLSVPSGAGYRIFTAKATSGAPASASSSRTSPAPFACSSSGSPSTRRARRSAASSSSRSSSHSSSWARSRWRPGC